MPTVIVIDDNEKMAALVADRLSKRGFSACYASNGESALKKLQEAKDTGGIPAICILDVVMSGLSGVQLMSSRNAFHAYYRIY